MAKIQDIDIPYLEFAEAAAPGTPASGIVRIYAKTDGSLYQKDDAGTETGLAGGGGGSDGYGPSGVYSPDRPPASGTVSPTDEFDGGGSVNAGWSWTGTAPTYDQTTYPGSLYVSSAKNVTNKLVRSYAPGATAFTLAAKVAMAVRDNDSAAWSWGISLLDSGNATIWEIYAQTSGTARAVEYMRVFGTSGTGGAFYVGVSTPIYLRITRDASNVYNAYWSVDGMMWIRLGGSTVGTTVDKVALVIPTNDNNGNDRTARCEWLRVFDSVTAKVGA